MTDWDTRKIEKLTTEANEIEAFHELLRHKVEEADCFIQFGYAGYGDMDDWRQLRKQWKKLQEGLDIASGLEKRLKQSDSWNP